MSKRKWRKNNTLKKIIKNVRTEVLAPFIIITDFRNATHYSSVDKCLSRIQKNMLVHPKQTQSVNDTIVFFKINVRKKDEFK